MTEPAEGTTALTRTTFREMTFDPASWGGRSDCDPLG